MVVKRKIWLKVQSSGINNKNKFPVMHKTDAHKNACGETSARPKQGKYQQICRLISSGKKIITSTKLKNVPVKKNKQIFQDF